MKSNRIPGSTYALFWSCYSGVTTPRAPTSPAAASTPARRYPGETNAPTTRAVTSGIIKYASGGWGSATASQRLRTLKPSTCRAAARDSGC